MAWSTPRVWAVGELLTAANMNTYVSDNLSYLYSAVSAEIEIFGASMWPANTNGAYGVSRNEMPTNKNYLYGMAFLPGTITIAQCFLPQLPDDYNGGSVTAKFIWNVNSSSTNSVVLGMQGVAYADGATMDAAFSTGGSVTDANTGTYYANITDATPQFIFTGTPAAGKPVQIRCYRVGAGADNHAGTINLLGAVIRYTRT